MSTVTDPLTRRLHILVESSPDLEEAAGVYKIILPLVRDCDLHAGPIAMTPGEARAKLDRGVPLLHDVDLALDDRAVYDLMIRLAHALEEPGVRSKRDAMPRRNAARRIRDALEQSKIEISALLPHVMVGDNAHVIALARDLQLDEGLLWALAQNALKPALRAWAKQLSPLAKSVAWRKGFCFICGAGATLGELQGNDQIKHLRCGQCGADWVFSRLQCMYCGNVDHQTLSYFYPDGERDKRRMEVCDRCKGYLKVIAAFDPTPPELLPLEDLATLHLDYVAQENGYARVAFQ